MKNKSKKTKCAACGSSQINHPLMYILSVMEETIGNFENRFFSFARNPKSQKITQVTEKLFFNTLATIGLVNFSNDIEKAVTGRSKLIWQEARKRGIEMRQAIAFGKPLEFYRAKINGKMLYYQSLPIPSHLHQSGYHWLDDKFKLFEVLSKGRIPVPKTEKIYNWQEALEAFETMKKPIIVKPKHGSLGRHTTTNINTKEELKKAFDLVKVISVSMVMQEHLFGSVCRATVINNELVAFFRADPPRIIGNGIKSIQKLIEEKNSSRPERISEISINNDLIDFIGRQGYLLDSIPENGITINLSAKTGRFYGGYTREMLPEVHPKMYEIFKKAGELVEAPVVGFDLIIEDPTKDPETQKWGVIECNSMPFIDLHYFALEGKPVDLAGRIWDLWKN